MKINKSPKLTSKNFNINDFEFDLKLLNKKLKSFDNFNVENLNVKKIENDIKAEYGLNDNFENANLKCSLEIVDNKKYGIINLDLNNNLLDVIELNINKDSNYLINYTSSDNYYHNGLIKVNVNSGVNASIIVVNNLNKESVNLISFDSVCMEDATLNYLIIDVGSKTSVSNYYCNLIGNYSNNNLKSIYLGDKTQVFDINYLVRVCGNNCNCNIDVQGALKDESKKSFKGTIDFKKGCKKSIGNENEYAVLLSDKVVSKSLPMLLCTEEDVVGNHSTASGKVNDKQLFYIMSRGISKKDALKLIVKSNFNKILSTIKDDKIKEEIEEIIDKKL